MKPTISIALLALGLTFPPQVVANEQSIIDRIEAQRTNKAELEHRDALARYEAHRKRWRVFTPMEYDWLGWKRSGTIYTTMRQYVTNPPSPKSSDGLVVVAPPQILSPEKISVDCRTLKVKEYLSEGQIARNRLRLQAESDPAVRERLRQVQVARAPDWGLPEKGSETAMVAARCAADL